MRVTLRSLFCVCAHTQLCPMLHPPWTAACQPPPSMGFSKQEYRSGLPWPPPGDLPDPGVKAASLASPALAVGLFIIREAQVIIKHVYSQFSRETFARCNQERFSFPALLCGWLCSVLTRLLLPDEISGSPGASCSLSEDESPVSTAYRSPVTIPKLKLRPRSVGVSSTRHVEASGWFLHSFPHLAGRTLTSPRSESRGGRGKPLLATAPCDTRSVSEPLSCSPPPRLGIFPACHALTSGKRISSSSLPKSLGLWKPSSTSRFPCCS